MTSFEKVVSDSKEFFDNDELAANVFATKYALERSRRALKICVVRRSIGRTSRR